MPASRPTAAEREQRAALRAIYGGVKERTFQDWLLRLAALLGWYCYHTAYSLRSNPGFPDAVLLHPHTGRLILAELKTMDGRLSKGAVDRRGVWVPGQREWLAALQRNPWVESYVFRPHHKPQIEALLQDPRRRVLREVEGQRRYVVMED